MRAKAEATKNPLNRQAERGTPREMSIDDMEEILQIEKKSFIAPWTRTMFGETLTSSISKAFVLEENKVIIGYIVFYIADVEAHIMSLAVDPVRRRQGYGRQLLSHAIKLLREDDISECYLEVREHNDDARGLYKKFGFEVIGRRKRYYTESGEDALVMQLLLR
jgi:ribosomal-protein-alanine N-acetyltransferase